MGEHTEHVTVEAWAADCIEGECEHIDEDGMRYVSTSIGGDGADSFWITDASGERIAGFAEDGTVTGQSGRFAGDLEVGDPIGDRRRDGQSRLP